MTVTVLLTLAAAAASAVVPAPSGAYTCMSKGMLATFRNADGWKAIDKLTPKNNFKYQSTRISFLPGNRVAIDLPADVINLSGDFYLQTTREGVTSWSASAPAYCGLIDAECTPLAALLPDATGGANLTITAPVVVTVGEAKQVGTFEISYDCERSS